MAKIQTNTISERNGTELLIDGGKYEVNQVVGIYLKGYKGESFIFESKIVQVKRLKKKVKITLNRTHFLIKPGDKIFNTQFLKK